jgi:4-hydroxy-tetrahydrodipicolinate synthase
MHKKFSGVTVPVITPLLSDYSIDLKAVEKIMNNLSTNSLHPLLLGTTGESCSINENNSCELISAAVSSKGAKQVIYAGLVGNQVDDLVKRGNQYLKLGVDVIVSTLPSYYTLNPEQMVNYYTMLADRIEGPVMMYNIKSTTQMSIPVDIIHQLSLHPNIWGLKDSERDIDRLKILINSYKNRSDFSFFCGWGAQGAKSLEMGADGIVPSTGNIVPELYRMMYQAFLIGDYNKAEYFQAETDEVAAFYQKGKTLGESLAALKVLMSEKKICGTTMMPPLTQLSDQDSYNVRQKFINYLKSKQ